MKTDQEVIYMADRNVMTVSYLRRELETFKPEITEDFQIWLSSDEEGNEYLPMLRDSELSIGIDENHKRLVFFPSHR